MSGAPASHAAPAGPNGAVAWTAVLQPKVEEALAHYPNRRSAILPLLWIAQREWGWLPPGVLRLVARTVELPEAEVFGVATFYTMFNLKPVGKPAPPRPRRPEAFITSMHCSGVCWPTTVESVA